MFDIEKFVRLYDQFDLTKPNIRNEIDLLYRIDTTIVDTDAKWIVMSDEEKQLKRIVSLKHVKKVLSDDRKDLFRLEESIIDLYESVIICLDKINKILDCKNEYIVRFYFFLSLEKYVINSFVDIRKIDDLYYSIGKAIIYDCLNGLMEEYFLRESGLLFFESKLEIAHRLLMNYKKF